MASNSAVRDSTSGRRPASDLKQAELAQQAIWAGFLTILIAGPWLGGGYVFGTDWPGPRRFAFPNALSNQAPLEASLSGLSQVLTGEWAGKVFIFAALFLAALMAYRAVPTGGFVPRAAASLVYVFNPFVFGRIHYGQLFLIAGYALLPWVAIRIHRLLLRPTLAAGLILAASLALVAVPTAHVFLMATFLVVVVVLSHLFGAHERVEALKRVGPSLLAAGGATFVAVSYWLVPFVLGRGPVAGVVEGVGAANLSVYAALPDDKLGLLPNLLGLYGFWAEGSGRFASMKLFVPFWPVVLVLLLSIGGIGVFATVKGRRDQLVPWVTGLLAAGLIGLVLEMGVSHPWTSGLVTWLDAHFSVYRGMRDAGKWAVLLAFVYSQLVGLGSVAILEWLKRRTKTAPTADWVMSAATGLLIALPLYYGNGLLFGMHGEIKASPYPAGWYQADSVVASDPHPGKAVFLPWHEYMAYSFIQNQNKVVAPPAPYFFSVPVIVSTNPDVPGTAPSTDPDQVAITNLVGEGGQGQWATVLDKLGIKYVVLAREVDWASFRYLDNQPGLVKVGDYGSIVLYRTNGSPGP
jgi:hypothetical protein